MGDGVHFTVVEHQASPPTTDVQQAYLMHFDGMETLCLQSNYRGPRANFAWVVPVPSRPQVSKGHRDTLAAIEAKTRPTLVTHKAEGGGFKLGCSAAEGLADETELGVRVLESGRVGELEMVVLGARDGEGLLQWLQRNGFHVPAKARPVLDEYARLEFYFVALRFAADALDDVKAEAPNAAVAAPGGTGATGRSDGLCIELRFATEQPFFPLAISSAGSDAQCEILVFTITERRQEPTNYLGVELQKLMYDERASIAADRKKLSTSPDVAALLREALWSAGQREGRGVFAIEAALPSFVEFDGDGRPSMSHLLYRTGNSRIRKAFITRFHAVMSPEQMRSDAYFRDAARDDRLDGKVYVSAVSRAPMVAAALVLAPVAGLGLGRRRRTQRRTQRRALAVCALLLIALA